MPNSVMGNVKGSAVIPMTKNFYLIIAGMFIWRNYNMLLQMFYFSFK